MIVFHYFYILHLISFYSLPILSILIHSIMKLMIIDPIMIMIIMNQIDNDNYEPDIDHEDY